jgi:hypothetical protein
MADETDRTDDPIDVDELPQEGNSNARIYPPADKDGAGDAREEEDPQQPPTGDAAAIREGEDQEAQSE